ncbi:dsDNA nuclease domain-containing protein [Chryseobacterium culicis]|uniref:dsDNA nuclease domain-containing protein n=1 Tax=Chryseobacterium culicis TaxID=680127 RepID=UPI0018756CD7|nr:dsDNA nuclease domain-containing protein [Chryseobacterium culicis]MBE4950883.1 DUF4297 domain-containing protein [Chryseobacterium culicis]
MSLHKLYLFAKNTDAPATEQGFQYQKLKTLKTWLENRINKIDEIIYCDYEEDIFQRNLSEGKAKFRQIKLYSSNFSLTKEEITKSISHFFMLFVKGEYKFDEISFVFETNSSIARRYGENNADLLQKWAQNQGNLDEELIEQCRERTKAILNDYIDKAIDSENSPTKKEELLSAKEIYNDLPVEIWNDFVSTIEWKFDKIPQNEAIPKLLSDIGLLISKLPLPVDQSKISTYISILHFQIATRTAKHKEEERVLSNELLDILILNEGSQGEKWYSDAYEKWSKVCLIQDFTIGVFYEIISAARYCRWNLGYSNHHNLWLKLLEKYISLEQIIISGKRKGIYEYISLLISTSPEALLAKGLVSEHKELIQYYFEKYEYRVLFNEIEEDIFLLSTIQVQQSLYGKFLDDDEILHWSNRIIEEIDEQINTSEDKDKICQAYQLKGHYLLRINPEIDIKVRIYKSLNTYREIIQYLDNTKTYSISTLHAQLIEFLNTFIGKNDNDEIVELIEDFFDEIEEYANKANVQHNNAHNLVARANFYLEKPSSKNRLKALDCLHKAKKMWFLNETKEGFILVLNDIAQLYGSLGMYYAAKYYGLCGIWACFQFGDHTTFKLISDSYGIVFRADFNQGAWMSALDSFKQYIKSRVEFNTGYLDTDNDEILRNTLISLSTILSTSPKLRSDIFVLIEYYKESFGSLYKIYLEPTVNLINEKLNKESDIQELLSGVLTDFPLNDLGKSREIKFNILGIDFIIVFINDFESSGVGEEFASQLQFMLCEIALRDVDLYFLETSITLNIYLIDNYDTLPEQQDNNDKIIWNIFIPVLDSDKIEKFDKHYRFIRACISTILARQSLLAISETITFFKSLYEGKGLIFKSLSVQSYQKVYQTLLKSEDFSELQRDGFSQTEILYSLDIKKNFLPQEGLSTKYNQKINIENIKNNQEAYLNRISISLPIWISDPHFKHFIQLQRNNGWLDWQIIIGLANFVINIKINLFTESLKDMDTIELRKKVEDEYNRISKLSEDKCYTEIPASLLTIDDFQSFIDEVPFRVLHHYNLENNLKYPNYKGIKVLLAKKFNFTIDNFIDNNPLSIIK